MKDDSGFRPLRPDRLYRHPINLAARTHISFSLISFLHYFLVHFFWFYRCCMYAYLSPLHMVTSSSLPYIGRFRPHALRLVLKACFSSPVPHYVPPEHFHSSMVHDQICMYPAPTVFFIWLVEAFCITRIAYTHTGRQRYPRHQIRM